MRNLTTGFLAQIAAPNVKPAIFVQIQFSTGTIFAWSGIGTVTWGSPPENYQGVGGFGAISGMSETTDVQAQSLTLSLNGIPSSSLTNVINDSNQTYSVSIFFGFLSATGAVIADPIMVFQGNTDVPTITCGPETSDISVSCESPIILLTLASARIWSSNDQFIDYPTDNGFGFVPSLQDWDGNWGTNGGQNPVMSGRAAGTGSGAGTSPNTGSTYGNPYGSHRND